MAVRLQMKLGFVAEQDRLPDSPDTVVPEEPTIGSILRSKGNLYLLVTARTPGARLRERLRPASPLAQRQIRADGCDKTTRRANRYSHQKAVQPSGKK